MNNFINPVQIIWTKFKNYYKVCDTSALRGATYGFVFSETKPKSYQQPCEFEECVYIGQSAGMYMDSQGGGRRKLRSHIHKRMTHHHKPLTTGEGRESSHITIIEKYGYGDNVIDGTITGKPLWLGLLIPRDDMPDIAVKPWAQMHEREQIFKYLMKYGRTPLGNKDCDSTRDPNSWSTKSLQNMGTLDNFLS